jgi:hypothetical protein
MRVVRRGATGLASPAGDATSRPLDVGIRPGPSRAAVSAGERAEDVEEPLLYTVQQAARKLHIGRTLAYQQAERYLATGGSDGIPTIKIGNCLRVPRPGLVTLAFTGRVVSPGRTRVLRPRPVEPVQPSSADRGPARDPGDLRWRCEQRESLRRSVAKSGTAFARRASCQFSRAAQAVAS